MRFDGKVALVTGAARGIGRAIALALAQEGADVVVVDVDLGRAQQVVQDIKDLGRRAKAISVDVSDRKAVHQLVSEAVSLFGRVDILVNNAGIIRRGTFLEHEPEEWERVLSVNLGGTFNCTREVVPLMIQQEGGRIINISSVVGRMGDIASAPSYGTSKGAIDTFTKSLARELAPHGITVNAVAPHAIETEMSQEWSEEKRQQIVEAIPMKRLGQPEEVAEAVKFLASDGAAFITGHVLDVNGGYLMV
ncbi:MAG TPA: 3-oxoacyl-ACP reductase family protein [Anaerolineae bacterium]|nr:3-oxoacyl-ACP reductase family protein [Anaerolineae bacterium]